MKKLLMLWSLALLCLETQAQPADSYLLSLMNSAKIPGLSVAIVKDGHLAYTRNLGYAKLPGLKPVTAQTNFLVSSLSNTMIATAVMQLWERNQLDLDKNINSYLPFSVQHPVFTGDSITIRQLLTHTACIQDNWNVLLSLLSSGDSPVSTDTFMHGYFTPGHAWYSVPDNFYPYHPGTQWNCSNISTSLAAYIVELITGDKFYHYCDTAIFQKLCMDNTSYLLSGMPDSTTIARPYSWTVNGYADQDLYGLPDYADGQLRTNAISLSRFMDMYMQRGIYHGNRILDSATIDYMMQQQTPVFTPIIQGLGFYARRASNMDTLWGQEGAFIGATACMYFNYTTKTGVIALANGEGNSTANLINFLDTLYQYGTTISPGTNDTFPACQLPSGIAQTSNRHDEIAVYPNPTNGNVDIMVPFPGTALITDITGRSVYSCGLVSGNNHLQLPRSMARGFYYVHISYHQKKAIVTEKMLYLP